MGTPAAYLTELVLATETCELDNEGARIFF